MPTPWRWVTSDRERREHEPGQLPGGHGQAARVSEAGSDSRSGGRSEATLGALPALLVRSPVRAKLPGHDGELWAKSDLPGEIAGQDHGGAEVGGQGRLNQVSLPLAALVSAG